MLYEVITGDRGRSPYGQSVARDVFEAPEAEATYQPRVGADGVDIQV